MIRHANQPAVLIRPQTAVTESAFRNAALIYTYCAGNAVRVIRRFLRKPESGPALPVGICSYFQRFLRVIADAGQTQAEGLGDGL